MRSTNDVDQVFAFDFRAQLSLNANLINNISILTMNGNIDGYVEWAIQKVQIDFQPIAQPEFVQPKQTIYIHIKYKYGM